MAGNGVPKNPLIAHLDRTLPVDGYNIGKTSTSIVKLLGYEDSDDFIGIVTIETRGKNGNPSSGLFGAPVDHLDESGESSGGRRITENGEILGLFTD